MVLIIVSNLENKKNSQNISVSFYFHFFPQAIFLYFSLKICPVILFLYSYSYKSLFFQTQSLLMCFTLWVLRETESRYEA